MAMADAPAFATRPMAFLSDIHGNLPALSSVLEELTRRGIHDVYVAGDIVFPGEQPLEVWQRLQQIHARCTRGASDTALVTFDAENLPAKTDHERVIRERFARTKSALGELVLARIKRLPEQIRVPLLDGRELVMVHGSPADPGTEITHDLDDDEIRALVGDDPADLILCGASHTPFDRNLMDVQVVNVGSVGAAPEGNVAHFCVVTPRQDGTEIEHDWVEF